MNYGTTSKLNRKDIRSFRENINRFVNNKEAQQNAKTYFSDHQPNVCQAGYYSASSRNWNYEVGMTHIARTGQDVQYFEVVTQFGEVKAARRFIILAHK